MLKLYKPEDWTKKNKKEGMKELTGGPITEDETPAKDKINSPPPGFEPQTKQNKNKISSPLGFEPQTKIPTAPTRPPPKTAPTTPPPKPEQKEKRVNKHFVPREDGGPVTRLKNKSFWVDVAKLNCDPKQNLIKKTV